ncbi:cold-shock protein [Rhizobium sp. TRM95111]|uniref:cold-shock protein n=1 Tax=Rhizobium alarense TaxID=2846851 RepID=UPI001F48BF77|nr:cold-shock protein [Rhizobium alarense]MCF3642214.1 cold-shock protein [Rhizobium alarense]
MSRAGYVIGDTVVLKSGLSRSAGDERTCRIVGILPADHGEAQYRVRVGNETYERRIVQSDIDAAETAAPAPERMSSETRRPEPWLKPLTTRADR